MKALRLLGLAAALALVFFPEVVLGRRIFWGADIEGFHSAIHTVLARALTDGEWARLVWHPGMQCGFPILAEGQVGAFYPLHWLTLTLLPVVDSLTVCLVISYLAAVAAMAALLLELGTSRAAALLAGLAYGLGGYSVGHVVHVGIVEGVPWLPLVLLLVRRGLKSGAPRWGVLAGIAWALQVMAGHPQTPAMTLLVAVLFAVFMESGSAPAPLAVRRAMRCVAPLVAVGLGVGAVVVWPMLALGRQSTRGGGMSYAVASAFELPLQQLVTFGVPFAFGGPDDYHGKWSFTETTPYVGLCTLLLAVAAVACRPRRREVLFFLALVLGALTLALGDNTPLFWLLHALPGFSYLRAPARFVFVVDFGLAALAAFGLDSLARPEGRPWRLRLAATAVAAGALATLAASRLHVSACTLPALLLFACGAWLGLAHRLSEPWFRALGVLLLVADLRGYVASSHRHWLVPRAEAAAAVSPAIEFVARHAGSDRVCLIAGSSGWEGQNARSLVDGFQNVSGYSSLWLRQVDSYLDKLWWTGSRTLLSAANVRYVVDRWQRPPAASATHDGVRFRLNLPLAALGEGALPAVRYDVPGWRGEAIALVAALHGSQESGTDVADLVLHGADGGQQTLALRAGADLAGADDPAGPELAYAGPTLAGLAVDRFYYRRIPVRAVALAAIEVRYRAASGQLWIQGLDLVDGSRSQPISPWLESGYIRVLSTPAETVYENRAVLPRAYAVHQVWRVPGPDAALQALATASFDPSRSVVLEDPVAPLPGHGGPCRVETLERSPLRVVLSTAMRGDGYVVSSDAYEAGWGAEVDGRPAPIYRANGAFRAVYVADGPHSVVFRYRPVALWSGAAVSVLSLGAAMLALVRARRVAAQAD